MHGPLKLRGTGQVLNSILCIYESSGYLVQHDVEGKRGPRGDGGGGRRPGGGVAKVTRTTKLCQSLCDPSRLRSP